MHINSQKQCLLCVSRYVPEQVIIKIQNIKYLNLARSDWCKKYETSFIWITRTLKI